MFAEEFTGGDVMNMETRAERGCVGAFADTRGTNQGDVHCIGINELWDSRGMSAEDSLV